VSTDPIVDERGEIEGFVCIIKDVTGGARLEERKRTEALETAATGARKSEFLAMLAHELRNPLAPILNSLEIIRLIGPVESGVEQALAIACRQVRHLARLLDDLLDVSRFDQGKFRLQMGTVDLREVVLRAIELVKPRTLDGARVLETKIPSGPIWLDGDAARLEQIVGNLLDNAVKFTDRGGKIALEVTKERGEVAIRIRDDGVGLGPEMLARVFDRFSQADLSVDRTEGGLGIGLTLVKSLVEMHGGKVFVASEGPGLGCEFTVRLPVAGHASAARPRRDETTEDADGSSHQGVLIIDDHPDSASSLAEILKYWGHRVSIAPDGPQGIALAEVEPFDLVLLDIGLPGMDGYQVAERLKHLDRSHRLKIVALTGYGQKEDFRKSREVGFDAHLVKPVDLVALQDVLEQLDGTSNSSSV
jgi:CheY-like chemotaxis protein